MKLTIKSLTMLLVILGSGLMVSAQDSLTGTPASICEQALPAEEPETRTYEQAEQVIEEGVDYRAILCTEAGPVYVDLLEEFAPMTVNNFVFLAENGYYNNTTFHRVIEDFMAQAGDPTATGSGGPGYQFGDEFQSFITFDRPGLLAMANAGPGTNGSQFFITTAETPWLNYAHTIFGDVLTGQENVTALELRDPATAEEGTGSALNTVVIITDPDAVDAEYEAIEPATAEDFTAALDVLAQPENLPEDLAVVEDAGTYTTEDVVSNVPDVLASAFEENNHDFRVVFGIVNQTCSDQYFFSSLGYTVDAFETAEDASAVLESEAYNAAAEELGFSDRTPSPTTGGILFDLDDSTCNDAAGSRLQTVLQRGRYLVTVEALVGNDLLEQSPPDSLVETSVARLFEQVLGSVYASELR